MFETLHEKQRRLYQDICVDEKFPQNRMQKSSLRNLQKLKNDFNAFKILKNSSDYKEAPCLRGRANKKMVALKLSKLGTKGEEKTKDLY
jgi:hypothetical protein